MEHCVQAWSPYLKKDVKTFEKVQRSASKLVPALRNLSYEDRLKKIGILPLEQRRFRGDLIETNKILHGIENIDREIFFERAKLAMLRGNSLKLFKKRSRLSVRNNFYSQRVIDDWNTLPNTIVEAPSLNSFKARLDMLHYSAPPGQNRVAMLDSFESQGV